MSNEQYRTAIDDRNADPGASTFFREPIVDAGIRAAFTILGFITDKHNGFEVLLPKSRAAAFARRARAAGATCEVVSDPDFPAWSLVDGIASAKVVRTVIDMAHRARIRPDPSENWPSGWWANSRGR